MLRPASKKLLLSTNLFKFRVIAIFYSALYWERACVIVLHITMPRTLNHTTLLQFVRKHYVSVVKMDVSVVTFH